MAKVKRRKRKNIQRARCTIYGLCEPGTDTVRYVGQTKLRLKSRFDWHRRAIKRALKIGKRLSPAQSWIYHLELEGKRPTFKVIDQFGTWDVSEILWIERYRVSGHNLLNVLRGGNDSYDAFVRDTGQRVAPLHRPLDDLEREYRDICG